MPPFSPQSYWKGEIGWVLRESIPQNLWRFPRNSSLRKSCTPTHSHVLREPTVASRMSSIWRFCFGSEHWIGNGSGKPFVQPLLCGIRTCFPWLCRSRLHHGTHHIGRWRQSAVSPGHYTRPFNGSGLRFRMEYQGKGGRDHPGILHDLPDGVGRISMCHLQAFPAFIHHQFSAAVSVCQQIIGDGIAD